MRNSRGKYTLEELLNAKRSEKPSPRFWDAFNDELRIKRRRLLQQQPVDDMALEPSLWPRIRKIGSLCLAAASCGAIGYFASQSLGPQTDRGALQAPAPEKASPSLEETRITIATRAPLAIETESKAETRFYEIPAARTSQGEPIAADSPVLAVASNTEPEPSIEGFTLALDTPFDSLQIDGSIGVDVRQKLTDRLMERYIHPLSDRGLDFEASYVANHSDPLNRLSTVAFKTNFFDLDAPKDLKLNTLSLRF